MTSLFRFTFQLKITSINAEKSQDKFDIVAIVSAFYKTELRRVDRQTDRRFSLVIIKHHMYRNQTVRTREPKT